MAFKLQLTDEMAKFFRSSFLSDTDAGKLIRMLLDKSEGVDTVLDIPQPLTYVLPVFCGQIDRFRNEYERKKDQANERKRRQVERGRENVTQFTRESRVIDSGTREERESRVNSVNDGVTREVRTSLHTIPHQSNPSTLTGGGGACGPEQEPPPPEFKRMSGIPWSRDDYHRLAISSGWPKEEADRFCDFNNSGKMHPVDALAAWSRNRTPTEAAGGASAVSSRIKATAANSAALNRAIAKFKDTVEQSSDLAAFEAENMPVWLRDCPDVPRVLHEQFRTAIEAILNDKLSERANQ